VLLISFLKRIEPDSELRGIHLSKLFIQTVDLEYEGEGEKGINPWNLAENLLKNSQKYF
jgi:hypothetical protein